MWITTESRIKWQPQTIRMRTKIKEKKEQEKCAKEKLQSRGTRESQTAAKQCKQLRELFLVICPTFIFINIEIKR